MKHLFRKLTSVVIVAAMVCVCIPIRIFAAETELTYQCDFMRLVKNGAKTDYGNAADVIKLDDNTTAHLTYTGTYADTDGKIFLTGGNNGKGSYEKGSYIEFIAPTAGEATFTANAYNYFIDGAYTGYNKASGTAKVSLKSGQKLQIGQRVAGTYISALSFEGKEEIIPVSSLKVQYKCGENIVKTIDVSTDELGVGDEYTYISANYIVSDDQKTYKVGADYTEDTEAVQITEAVSENAALKQTVTLQDNTIITYNVSEIPNVVLYGEWEDILNTSAFGASNDRYIASGGKMTTTTQTVSFLEIEEDGYYQILVMGNAQKRGTAIYRNETEAKTAVSAVDGRELLNIYYNSNNTVYRVYSVKTVHLKKGDNLTVRGFGSNGTTDNLDYVVVRRVYKEEISGADGISILPDGVTEKYSYEGAASSVQWSVMGVAGVNIDNNGNLTVSENADEGTAIIKIMADGTEITKNVTVAKPQIADFTLKGASVISKGGTSVYSATKVFDQFGRDITDKANISFSSSNSDIIEIDNNGTATVKTDGTTVITVKVSVGNSEKFKTINVATGTFSVIANADGDMTTVNTTELNTISGISSFLVTTATNGGVLVNQTTVAAADSVDVNTKNADAVEITPIYEFTEIENPTSGYILPVDFADGAYDITIEKADKNRADIYINDKMIGNDVDRAGSCRAVSAPCKYKAVNVKVSGGQIKVRLGECANSSAVSSITAIKTPSIITKKTKITIIGGSCEATYYGEPTGKDMGGYGSANINQYGWGERLYRFLDAVKYDIVNLSSGDINKKADYEILNSAFANSEKNDIVIAVCDYSNMSETELYEYMEKAAGEANKTDTQIIFATALISADDSANYSASAKMSGAVKSKAAELNKKVIDLTSSSYTCVNELYGDNFDTVKSKYTNSFGLGDGVNLSFAGATKYAELAAKELRNIGAVNDFNLQYEYKTPDADGNVITASMNDNETFVDYTLYKDDNTIGITIMPETDGIVYAAMYNKEGALKEVGTAENISAAKTIKLNRPTEDGCIIKIFNWNDNMMPLSNPSKPIEVDYIQEPSSDSADNMKYGEDGVKYRYYLPQNYDSEKSYPIVMYLHGAGRRGGNNNDQLVNDQYIVNSLLSEKYINNPDTQCIIIAPQCPSNEKWVNIPAWDTGSYEHDLYSAGNSLEAAHRVVMKFAEQYNVDKSRIYISGQSMGGYGTWRLAADYADVYAAAIPLCSGGPLGDKGAGELAAADMPIWAFHGTADNTVTIDKASRAMMTELQKYGATKAKLTELEGRNHEIQGEVFTAKAAEVGLYEWLFAQKKNMNSTVTNGYDSQRIANMNCRVKAAEGAPAVIYLAGQARYGTDNTSQMYDARYIFKKLTNSATLIAPQTENGFTEDSVTALISEVKAKYSASSVTVIGQEESAAAAFAQGADRVMVIDGASEASNTTADVWAFSGYENKSNPDIRSMVNRLQNAGAAVRYTEYPFAQGNIADKASEEEGLTDWILGQSEDNKTVDLVLFSGQSNMAGRGDYDEATVVPAGQGYEYHSVTEPKVLSSMQEPFGKYENNDKINDNSSKGEDRRNGDMVSSLMKAYYDKTGVPIVGVQASKGGQPVTFFLNTSDEIIKRYNDAEQYLTDSGYTVRNKYLVWCQGESDIDKQGAYKENTLKAFDAIRKGTGIKDCFIIQIGHYNYNYGLKTGETPSNEALSLEAGHQAIIKLQDELATENDFIHIAATFNTDFALANMRDKFHYYQPVYNEVGSQAGKRMAEISDIESFELTSSEQSIDVSRMTSYGSDLYRLYNDDGYTEVMSNNGVVENTTGGTVTVVPVYKFTYRQGGKDGYIDATNAYDATTGYGLVSGVDYGINASGANCVDGRPLKVDLPYGRYDVSISRSASRADIYSNGYIIVNNTTASEQNRPTGEATFEAPSVLVDSGNLNLTMSGNSGVRISELEIAKVPEKYQRPTIYVAGDSESANYYPYDTNGEDLENDALMMTGFGMQLKYFMSDNYGISNMGQPSATVKTWYDECFEGVMHNIKAGDVLLIDFGINDAVSKNNSLSVDEMKAVMTEISEAVKAKGAQPVLMSPVACGKYQDRAYFTYNKETGVNDGKLFADSIDIPFIDLNKYLSLYIDKAAADTDDTDWRLKNYQIMKDNLHITQYGALLTASFICAGLDSMGYTSNDYAFEYTDSDSVDETYTRTKGINARTYSVQSAKEFMAECDN